MIALSGHFLDIMVIIMLAIVGGLVLWLHFSLYKLKNTEKGVPLLVDSLSESLKKANRGVFELSRLVRENGPKLEDEIFKAGQTVQDLDFMLNKAEKLLKRMDEAFERSENISTPVLNAIKKQEKEVLLNKKTDNDLNSSKENKNENNKIDLTKQGNEIGTVSEASKRLEAEMQKALERELLMGMETSGDMKKVKQNHDLEDKVVSKRMASPMKGAMAYGQTVDTISDAEMDLRQALEGRL